MRSTQRGRGKDFNRIHLLGFICSLNRMMRMINGNGRRRLLFSHQNFRGGALTTNQDKRNQLGLTIKNTRPDVLGISDTKLGTNENGICNIEGYNWESKLDCPRINVLVNNSLQYRRRKDLEADGIACIFIELSPANKNPILVANVYREWQREGEPGSENEGPQFERWKKFSLQTFYLG